MRRVLCLLVAASACGSNSSPGGQVPIVVTDAGTKYFGEAHSGNFWLGPVDFSESEWHNACAPSAVKYPSSIQNLYGNYLMGLSNQLKLQSLSAGSGQLCDVCAELSANGVTLIAHVVTYGDETGTYDIDVSPEARTALHGETSYALTWRFVTCPTTAPIYYNFDGRDWANTWYFRVWIRNSRVPVAKVEFKLGANAWAAAEWQSDGAWQASGGDFKDGFSLRVTSLDGQTIEDTLPGVGKFDANTGVASLANFQ